MAESPSDACLNCGRALEENFCSFCGQKRLNLGASLGEIVREAAGETFELDGRVPRTLLPFLFQPGRLTREYLAGRRASYTSPFRLFLAVTVIWALAGFGISVTTDFEAEVREQLAKSSASGDPSEQQRKLPGFLVQHTGAWGDNLQEGFDELRALPPAQEAEAAYAMGVEAVPRAVIFAMPFFALILKLLYARTGRVYVDHLVFALHVHAFAFALLTIGIIVDHSIYTGIGTLVVCVYTFLAMRTAYEGRWWTTALRFAGFIPLYGFGLAGAALMFMILSLAF